MNLRILLLPGDGIGAEVTSAAVTVLNATLRKFGHTAQYTEGLIGGIAIHKTGKPLPEDTMNKALDADATLMGAVGLPEFDNTPPSQRPERGLLDLRGGMEVFANLRPVKAWPSLIESSPLKNHLVEGVDLLIVRELTGGLYFGTPRGIVWDTEHGGKGDHAYNTMTYSRTEISRIAHKAFQFARQRRRKLTSVDKPNVLECSQLWRKVVTEIGAEYPDVELDHMLVDTCAMQLVLNPKRFDVILTENMFGDILSDEGAVLAGSIGMLPSASLGEKRGLYEPVHGSAPDIAGQNKANPLGAIGSAAAMLEYSFGLLKEAAAINAAIGHVLEAGKVTADLKATGLNTTGLNTKGKPLTTEEVGTAVSEAL